MSPEESLESKKSRGPGMYIIKTFVDEMSDTRGDGDASNGLRLTKII